MRGEKGTAKSTAVRALAALLPALDVVAGCRFSCDPAAPDPTCPDGPHEAGAPHARRPARLVELPVGATEDRLIGSLDLERALAEGVRAYQPGLLADAHRGVLYVDEVNLLHDHLVDALLDAAAMGRAHVERDGVSVSHAARFLLVGTMNPEEGELRPQLLDRFGLAVEVRAARDVATRVDVVRRRLAFDDDPVGFAAAWADAEQETAARIADAQARVGSVALPDAELRRIAAVCAAFDVDGMRADLVIARAAIAHAAWRGADAVEEEDVRVAARLALPHRRRRDPFDESGVDEQALDDALEQARKEIDSNPRPGDPDGGPDGPGGGRAADEPDAGPSPNDSAPGAAGEDAQPATNETAENPPEGPLTPPRSRQPDEPDRRAPAPAEGDPVPPPGPSFRARRLVVPGVGEGAPGRRSRARTDLGRVVRASDATPRRAADVHLPATSPPRRPHQHAPRPGRPPAPAPRRRAARRARGSGGQPRAVRRRRVGVDGGDGRAWPPSRARCCRCCATPTSAGTRSG